jgi:trans-aconitate 3-methyltransferase
MATATHKVSDPTFRSYTAEQAKTYASRRLSYPHAFYDAILSRHSATGGQFNLLLDVGCGPGNATRDVAPSFDRAVGVDAGPAMIGAARELGGRTRSGCEIRFEVSPAEELSHVEGLELASVDLLIAAMAVRNPMPGSLDTG